MRHLLLAEFAKILGRRMTWILLVLLQLIGPATVLLFKFVSLIEVADSGLTESLGSLVGFPNGYMALLALNAQFGSFLAMIFAAFFVGSEFNWGTIRQLFARGPRRSHVLIAKLIALVVSVVAAISLTMVISGITMWVSDLAFSTIAIGQSEDFASDLFDRYVSTIGVLLFYGLLGFAIAILTRSAAAGMAIPLVFVVFMPVITEIAAAVGDGFWDALPDYLPHRLEPTAYGQQALMAAFAGLAEGGDFSATYSGPDRAQAIGLMALYSLGLVALAILVTARRDFPQSG